MDIDTKFDFISDKEIEEIDVKKLKLAGIWVILINLIYVRF